MQPQPQAVVRGAPTLESSSAYGTVGCQLIADLLRLYGSARVQVTGSSMLPYLFPGDTLIVQRQELQHVVPGDIVLFEQRDRLVTHRVVGGKFQEDTPYLSTRGDSLSRNDSPVFADQLRGRVIAIVRGSVHISPQATLWGELTSVILRHSYFLKRCLLCLLSRTRYLREGSECRT
jgi:signal peptidase